MASKPIHAAGGIVVRAGARPLIAVVQRSKDEAWVLPRGKLKRDENPAAGAKREALEETGHRVHVHEFLGAITYRVRGRPKVVQFWRMRAAMQPSQDVMKDIVAVEWLPLSAAVRRLSYPLEKLFLHQVGRRALKRHSRKGSRRKVSRHKSPRSAKARHRRVLSKSAVARARKKQRPARSRRQVRSARPGILTRMFGRNG
jgi:8-oxo-dGTP diphosphatase